MNSFLAAIIALLFGAAAAWYLYYYRNKGSESTRVLALLRLLWFSALVYALLAPPVEREVEVKLPNILQIAVDTSASVAGDLTPALEAVEDWAQQQGVTVSKRPFDASALDAQWPWAYFGDGHIESVEEVSAPIWAYFTASSARVNSAALLALRVPRRVAAGSSVTYEAVLNGGAQLTSISLNANQLPNMVKGSFRAPQTPGTYTLFAVGEKEGLADTLRSSFEVVPYLMAVQIIYAMPHPHVGVYSRRAQSQGIGLQTALLRDPAQLADLPTIAVGWNDDQIGIYLETHQSPVLWLGAGEGDHRRQRVEWRAPESWQGPVSDFEATGMGRFSIKDRLIDARGTNWYATALYSTEGQSAAHALLNGLLQLARPNTLEIELPDRLSLGERMSGSALVVGGDGSPAPSALTASVFLNGALVDRPVMTTEGNAHYFNWSPTQPGTYTWSFQAHALGEEWRTDRTLTVDARSIEEVRPFNEGLWSRWAKDMELGVFRHADSLEQALNTLSQPVEMVTATKEKPQHASWAYWGLVIGLAGAEWLLRRRQGLR